MAVDLKDVEKEQYTPLGTKLKIGTLSNLEKLRIMSQEANARGALMRGVGTGIQGVGKAYEWITEPLKIAATDPSKTGSGEAILGSLLIGAEKLTQMSGRGAEMWATGANIQNPITKQDWGHLPRHESGQPWVDPDVARTAGEALTGAALEGGAGKVISQVGKLTKGLKIADTLTPSPVAVTADGLKIKPNNPLMIKGVKGADNVLPTLSPEDQIIRETFPRIKSKHDKSLIEALSGNPTGAAAELRELVLQQNKKLQHAPTITLDNGRVVKVTRLVKGEAQDIANRISDLKKQLNLSAPSKYDQITGYYVEGNSLFRLNSKGKLVKIQDNVDRNILEKLWPVDESLKTKRQLQTAAREKHHFRILEPSKIFAQVRDKGGNWVKRSQKQIDNVTARLQKDGVFIGNQDLNEVFQTKAAHIGAGGNRYGSHAQLRMLTDVQGRTLADADFLKIINKQDGTTVWVKQVKNKQGIVTDFVTETGEKIKPSHIGETLEYKVGGRTYDPKAMHGFSKEGIEYISKIKGDDELYNAMKLYYEINDEAYKGVAGLASKLVDAKVDVDDLTKNLVKEFSPETQNWINHLLTLPEYKRDTRLLQTLIRNSKDLLTLPKYKNNLKLQSLAKRIQTGLDTQKGLTTKYPELKN